MLDCKKDDMDLILLSFILISTEPTILLKNGERGYTKRILNMCRMCNNVIYRRITLLGQKHYTTLKDGINNYVGHHIILTIKEIKLCIVKTTPRYYYIIVAPIPT